MKRDYNITLVGESHLLRSGGESHWNRNWDCREKLLECPRGGAEVVVHRLNWSHLLRRRTPDAADDPSCEAIEIHFHPVIKTMSTAEQESPFSMRRSIAMPPKVLHVPNVATSRLLDNFFRGSVIADHGRTENCRDH